MEKKKKNQNPQPNANPNNSVTNQNLMAHESSEQ